MIEESLRKQRRSIASNTTSNTCPVLSNLFVNPSIKHEEGETTAEKDNKVESTQKIDVTHKSGTPKSIFYKIKIKIRAARQDSLKENPTYARYDLVA